MLRLTAFLWCCGGCEWRWYSGSYYWVFSEDECGSSYVIFGHAGSWVTPFNLTTVNGVNGVEFKCENVGDDSGSSVGGIESEW